MTLYKQIGLMISSLFIVMLLVVTANELSRAGKLQQVLMQNTARDAANGLAMTIGELPDGDDPAALAVLFDAMSSSGYFKRIELAAADGRTIFERSRQPQNGDVPEWFVSAVPLQPATYSASVTRENVPVGQLNVELHPALVYGELYHAAVSSVLWSAALLFAGLTLSWLLLHRLLRPLQQARQLAEAIHNNQFIQQETIPHSPELKSVVKAMNLMITRVQGIFDEQERTLNRYQKLLYRDRDTEVGNRRYLLEYLQQSISEESDRYQCMAIVKILDFDQSRGQHGYEFSSKLARLIADLLQQEHTATRAERLSRFNEDEFAFLMTVDEEAAVEFINRLFEDFRTRAAEHPDLASIRLVAGICDLQGEEEIGSILSNIDYCLSRASTRGPFSIEHQMSTSLDLPQGKMNWRNWLEAVLEAGDLYLVGQLAVSNNRIPVQRELFVRVRNAKDQEVPASAFMPMAASLGMSLDIDREVFRLILSNKELDRRIPLAINLSAAFFELAEAQEEFDQMLAECERNNTRLCIEASHHVLDRFPAMRKQVSERVRRHGHRFGVDNLDLGQSLQLLQSGRFDYVKIGAATLHEMVRNEMTASYQALRTLGDTLDIMIIAVAVDSQEVYSELGELGIENMQGYFLGPPEEV